jgi:hypothetical protein
MGSSEPALTSWAVNQRLRCAEESYVSDQGENQGVAAIAFRAKRLAQYVKEIEDIYRSEIATGRLSDTPELWAGIYDHLMLWVKAQTNSMISACALELMRTNGGRTGERGSLEEAQRALNRLAAEIESKLASAHLAAEREKTLKFSKIDVALGSSKVAQGEKASQYNEELIRIGKVCRGRRNCSETQLRTEFPNFAIWNALDNSRVSSNKRESFFVNPEAGTQDSRFDLIGEILGVAGATAYDWFKAFNKASGKRRPRRRSL